MVLLSLLVVADDDDDDDVVAVATIVAAVVPFIANASIVAASNSLSEISKTLRLGNLFVVAIVGIEIDWKMDCFSFDRNQYPFLERFKVWSLLKVCGALIKKSRFGSLVWLRSKVTKCSKMG